VGRILAAKSNYLGHRSRSNVLKPNQANSGDRMSVLQFRAEARGEFALHYFRINTKIRKDAPANCALNYWKSHLSSWSKWLGHLMCVKASPFRRLVMRIERLCLDETEA
jgi:hypothetical protein